MSEEHRMAASGLLGVADLGCASGSERNARNCLQVLAGLVVVCGPSGGQLSVFGMRWTLRVS